MEEPSDTPPRNESLPKVVPAGPLEYPVMFPERGSILITRLELRGTSQMEEPSNTPPAKAAAPIPVVPAGQFEKPVMFPDKV